MINVIKDEVLESAQTKQQLLDNENVLEEISKVAQACIDAYKSGRKTIFSGNGGSAADAQHLAAELVGRYAFDRKPLPGLALTTDTSMLTAIGNDYGYEQVFSRQLEGQAQKGDVFFGISTSGNSKNIVEAFKKAKEIGVVTVSLIGNKECEMEKLSDYTIKVPSTKTPRIQECHILIGHIICGIIENELFKK